MDSEANRAVGAAAVPPADEGAGGAAGPGGSPGGPEGLGLPGTVEGQGDPGGPGAPSGAGGPDTEGGPGSPNGQDGNNQGGPGVLGGSGVEGPVESAARDAPSVAPAASGPGGGAAPAAVRPGNPQMVFTISVTFESYLEAEMARLSLDMDAQDHWQGLQMMVTVNGSILFVKWIAEDLDELRDSIRSFLELLSLVVQAIQSFRDLIPPSLTCKTGAGA